MQCMPSIIIMHAGTLDYPELNGEAAIYRML